MPQLFALRAKGLGVVWLMPPPMPEAETKTCQNCHASFVIDRDDFAFYEMMQVPAPTFCPDCRLQRRLMFRNEHFLYKVKSDFSEKEIFSMHPPEGKLKIYENDAWYSDQWNAMSFGRDYDFSKPFFVQLNELFRSVPVFALSVIRGLNSNYSNNFDGYKNCYMCFNGNFCEDCMYSVTLSYSKNSHDLLACAKCENCYESFWLDSCTNCFYSIQCSDSYNLWFCKNCVGCNDCFGSVNLRNKKYHIFNEPYTKETYAQKLKEFQLDSYASIQKLQQRAKEFWLQHPVRFMQGLKNTRVSGEYIYQSKNAKNSFLVREAESVRYTSYIEIGPLRDCYDYSVWGSGAERVYEAVNSGLGIYNVRFAEECWSEVRDAEYSLFCQSSSNLFGCAGVRKKQYAILNKEYSKEDFQQLRAKIIEHMNSMPYIDSKGNIYKYGEFFPPMLSPYAYNHTPAHEHFPLTKERAGEAGCFWKENEDRGYAVTKKASELPDVISKAADSITSEIILCDEWEKDEEQAKLHNCTKAFLITPRELAFYRRYNLPLPRKCFYSRHHDRLKNRNPFKIYDRTCAKCHAPIQTSYAPDQPEIVYCETCYQQEVV